ncbi:MAG: glycosyltransferase family 4 protein [Erysipelotrichaceae bacterium]|nr:glycosyltransferase family 4 protein [Erysipelotrichaceae bacterium]
MNILMVGVDRNRLGGMWTVADNYIERFKDSDEVDLHYVATTTNGSVFKRLFIMFEGFYKISHILRCNNIDIVHIHMAEKGSTFRKLKVVKLCKKYKCKVIIHLHAGPYMKWFNSLSSAKKNKIMEFFKVVDMFFVLGEYWKEELSSIVDIDKIKVVYNGTKIPAINHYNNEGNYISYFGVFKKEKGIYDLIDGIKNINNVLDKEIKVVLCGLDLEGDIDKYIRDRKLQNRIINKGWVSGQDKLNVLNKTIVSVLPSYYEGLSMSVIESMAYGIPVITTNISTMPEILGDEKELIEPGNSEILANKIFQYCQDKKLRSDLSEKEYSRALSVFSLESNISVTLSFYRELSKV